MTHKELYNRVLQGESITRIALNENTRYDVGEVSYGDKFGWVVVDTKHRYISVRRVYLSQVAALRWLEKLAVEELAQKVMTNTKVSDLPTDVLEKLRKASYVVVLSSFGVRPDTMIQFRRNFEGFLEMFDVEEWELS